LFFEGKIDYDVLGITGAAAPWEFMQRGIHRQDDLEDREGAIADYREALKEPSLMTPRMRLGVLLREEDPVEAIWLFREILEIDPARLKIHYLIGEGYREIARNAEGGGKEAALGPARGEVRAEPAPSPGAEVTRR